MCTEPEISANICEIKIVDCLFSCTNCMLSFFFRQPQLLRGVFEMGFNAPSKIQETALPTLLADP
jgi:superfamily II DNA/RNA helicase